MAEHTISGQPWPNGTAVAVYSANGQPAGGDGVPLGQPVASAVVADGAVTFSGLAERISYVAYAAGVGRRFLIPQLSPETRRGLRERLDELEGDTLPSLEAGVAVASASEAIGHRVIQALEFDTKDVVVQVISDSTGNETIEWPYLLFTTLLARYPRFSFVVHLWTQTIGVGTTASGSNQLTGATTSFVNGQTVIGAGIPAGTTILSGGGTATVTMSANATASGTGVVVTGEGWAASPTTVQVGTGAYTLHLWVLGQSSQYLQQAVAPNFDAKIGALQADLIFVSHGHNYSQTVPVISLWRDIHLMFREQVARACPLAEIVHVAQNPETDDTTKYAWQAILADIAQMRGDGYVNAMRAFYTHPAWPLIDPAPGALMLDHVHPNAAGSALWANTVLAQLMPGAAARASTPPRGQQPSSLTPAVANLLANGDFSDAGTLPPAVNLSTNPGAEVNTTGWAIVSGGVLTRDTTEHHSGVACFKGTTDGSSASAGITYALTGILPNQLYTRMVWVKAAVGVRLRLVAIPNVSAQPPQVPFIATGDWQLVTIDCPSGPSDTSISWSVRGQDATPTTFYVDDDLIGLTNLAVDLASWALTNVTVTRDVANYEGPQGYALRIQSASAAAATIDQALTAGRLRQICGGWVTFAIRVRVPGGGISAAARVRITETGGSSAGAVTTTAFANTGYDEFRWVCVTRRIAKDATGVSFRIYADSGSSGLGDITVDRAIVAAGLLPRDIR